MQVVQKLERDHRPLMRSYQLVQFIGKLIVITILMLF